MARIELTVLIVEGATVNDSSIADALRRHGHEVVVAFNLWSAKSLARTQVLDAVILQVGDAEGTGFRLARDLRHQYLSASAVIVAFSTGGPEPEPRDDDAAIDLHLTMPVDVEMLSGLLHYLRTQRLNAHRPVPIR